MREFQFKSFSSVPESLQPSMQQQEAADNLVRMLDLSPDEDEELLQPEQTVNPILQVRVILPQGFVRWSGTFCNPSIESSLSRRVVTF